MSLFDKMLDREKPKLPVISFIASFRLLRDHVDLGGSIGTLDVPEFRRLWTDYMTEHGGAWEASDEAEYEIMVSQCNTAIANGHDRQWFESFYGIMCAQDITTIDNKVSKGDANRYLASVADGTVDQSPIEWIAATSRRR